MPIAIGATFIAGAIATFELQGRWLKELVLLVGHRRALQRHGEPASMPIRAAPTRWPARRSGCAGSASALGNGASWVSPAACSSARSRTSSRCSSFPSPAWHRLAFPVRRVLADLRAVRRGHWALLLRAAYVRQSPVRGDRAARAAFYAINVAIAYRLTQVFHSATGCATPTESRQRTTASSTSASSASWSSWRRRAARSRRAAQARALRRARADRRARAAARRHGGRGEPRGRNPVRLRRRRARRREREKAVRPDLHGDFDRLAEPGRRARVGRGLKPPIRGATASTSSASGRLPRSSTWSAR